MMSTNGIMFMLSIGLSVSGQALYAYATERARLMG